jgi:hypothetical protein
VLKIREHLSKEMFRHDWWLTSVTLATQEIEIGRIVVRSQPGANSSGDPSSKKKPSHKKDWWVAQDEGSEFKPQYCKKKKKCLNKAPYPTSLWYVCVIYI